MGKKRVIWLSVFLMVLALTFGKRDVAAAEFMCGLTEDDITWELYYDGTLIINGTGKVMNNLQYNTYKDMITKVVVGEGIDIIDGFAFTGYASLKEVELPGTLTQIGNNAFQKCSSLKEVKVPSEVKYIGRFAFNECSSLEKINFPKSLRTIGYNAFSKCTSLKSAIIPDSITDFQSEVFKECTSLQTVKLPIKLKKISDDTFHKCYSLEEVIVPVELDEIGSNAFSYCYSLPEISIPESVTSVTQLGNNCFSNCYALSNIEMSDKLLNSLSYNAKRQYFSNTKWYIKQTAPFNGRMSGCTYVINADYSMTVSGPGYFTFSNDQDIVPYQNAITTIIIGERVNSVSLRYSNELMSLEKIVNNSEAVIELRPYEGYSWCDINDQTKKITKLGKGTAIRVKGDLPENTGNNSGNNSQSGNGGSQEAANSENTAQSESEKVNTEQVAEVTGLMANAKAKVAGGITVQASADGSSVKIVSADNKKKLSIPATVKVNGEEYPVTEIAKKAVTGKKVAQLTVDARNLKTVNKDAFKGAKKLSKVIVKKAKKGTRIAKQIEKAAKRANKKAKVSYKK